MAAAERSRYSSAQGEDWDVLGGMLPRYHTLQVEPGDRVDYWRGAMISSLAAECSIEPTGDGPFDAAMAALDCGPLQLLQVSGSPFWIDRHGPGRPDWVSLLVQLEGQAMVADRRRQAQLGPGDLCLIAPDRDICVHRQTRFRQVLVDLPAGVLREAWPDWVDHSMQRLDAVRPAVQATAELTRFIAGHGQQLGDDGRDAIGEAVLRLIEKLAGPRRRGRALGDAAAPAASAALRQRRRAEAFIREHLHDRHLDVARIAAHLGVSNRYLHRLFADGPQVMQWALEQRLQACREELAGRGTRPVADIAWAWGFASAAHFSRAFKKRFGVPPSAA